MTDPAYITSTRIGIAGGILTIIIANINSGEVFKTVVLALIGAVVSYGVTALLKFLLKKWQK